MLVLHAGGDIMSDVLLSSLTQALCQKYGITDGVYGAAIQI